MVYLPNEIFVFIVHCVKPSEWFNLRRVNKHFMIIIESITERYPLMRDKLALAKAMPSVDEIGITKNIFSEYLIEKI